MSHLKHQTTEETALTTSDSLPQDQEVSVAETVQTELSQVSTEGEAFLAALRKEVKRRRIWLQSAVIATYTLYCMYRTFQYPKVDPSEHVWSAWLSIAAILFLIWTLWVLQDSRNKLQTLLTQQTDVRAIGIWLDLRALHERPTYSLINRALTALLPKLRASDAILLNQQQRRELYNMLKERKDRSFVLIVLSALEQIGDSDALWPVEQLAEGQYLAAKDAEIRQRAVECLEYLQIHASEVDAQQILLRASNTETGQPEQLLRPVKTAEETPADQLLRAPTDT